jgi:di/tricarboxylate transporter
MTIEIIAVLAAVVAAVILFATERLPADLIAVIIMAGLLLSGLITPEEGIAGFSNTATITVGAMFVLSAGLYRTGAVNAAWGVLARLGRRSYWLALITMMLSIGAISAFINNTAAVAIFLPFGYQTNTLIYGPGQYRFADFLRVGTPLNILMWLLATFFIPRFWPF